MAEEEFESDADEVAWRMLNYQKSAEELGATVNDSQFLWPHIDRMLQIVEHSLEVEARILAAFALGRQPSEFYPCDFRLFGEDMLTRIDLVIANLNRLNNPYDNNVLIDYLYLARENIVMRVNDSPGLIHD